MHKTLQMQKITIPKPCHEDWHQMAPTDKGAFCQSCAKEVIDFTNMTDDEVKLYLLKRTNEKLCGRFKQQQLDRIEVYLPSNFFLRHIAGWKKFMAILLIAFGTTLIGCDVILNQPVKGEAAFINRSSRTPLTGDTIYTTTGVVLPPVNEPKIDTTNCGNEIMGKLVAPPEIKRSIAITRPDSIIQDIFINGNLKIDTVKIQTLDTLTIKQKNPADTSDCGKDKFY